MCLSYARPGNELQAIIAVPTLLLFGLVLFSDTSLVTCVGAWFLLAIMTLSKGRWLLNPDTRPLFLATYRTSLHLPIWVDGLGYLLVIYASWVTHNRITQAMLLVLIGFEAAGRIGCALQARKAHSSPPEKL